MTKTTIKPKDLIPGVTYSVEAHPDDGVWVDATYVGTFSRRGTQWAIFDSRSEELLGVSMGRVGGGAVEEARS